MYTVFILVLSCSHFKCNSLKIEGSENCENLMRLLVEMRDLNYREYLPIVQYTAYLPTVQRVERVPTYCTESRESTHLPYSIKSTYIPNRE